MSIEELSVPSGDCGSSCAGTTFAGRGASSSMNAQGEIWKEVPGFDNVRASSLGRIGRFNRKIQKWIENRGAKTGAGYFCVTVKEGRFQCHRLVALAFHPNPNGYPEVHHLNHITDDNRPENLSWCTHAQNSKYSVMDGRYPSTKGEKSNCRVLNNDLVRAIRSDLAGGMPHRAAGKKYGISHGHVGSIRRREIWDVPGV